MHLREVSQTQEGWRCSSQFSREPGTPVWPGGCPLHFCVKAPAPIPCDVTVFERGSVRRGRQGDGLINMAGVLRRRTQTCMGRPWMTRGEGAVCRPRTEVPRGPALPQQVSTSSTETGRRHLAWSAQGFAQPGCLTAEPRIPGPGRRYWVCLQPLLLKQVFSREGLGEGSKA